MPNVWRISTSKDGLAVQEHGLQLSMLIGNVSDAAALSCQGNVYDCKHVSLLTMRPCHVRQFGDGAHGTCEKAWAAHGILLHKVGAEIYTSRGVLQSDSGVDLSTGNWLTCYLAWAKRYHPQVSLLTGPPVVCCSAQMIFSDQPGAHKIRLGTPKGIAAGRWRSSLGSAGMP